MHIEKSRVSILTVCICVPIVLCGKLTDRTIKCDMTLGKEHFTVGVVHTGVMSTVVPSDLLVRDEMGLVLPRCKA